MTQQYDNLDQLLTQHLSATLEPQVGRAAAAFRRHVQTTVSPVVKPSVLTIRPSVHTSRDNVIPRRALWYWAGVPSALAALLALVLAIQFFNSNRVADNPVANGSKINPVNTGTISFDTNETSRDINGGVAVLNDDTPVRVFRRQGMRQTQWVDPSDNATYSLTEPVEKVGYVKLQPY